MQEMQLSRQRVVQFNYDRFRDLVQPLGYRKVEEQREFIGVSESTFWRARNVRGGVSDDFIGSVLRTLRRITYDDLFFEGEWIDPRDVA